MKKAHKLSNITIKEVSLVDKAANKKRFLFFKRDGESEALEAIEKKNVEITITSDGTVSNTKLKINGSEVENLSSFDCFFNTLNADKEAKIHCSYTIVVEDKAGFKNTETFHLAKGDKIMKTKDLLKKYFDEDTEVTKEDRSPEVLEKAAEVLEQYKGEFPTELKTAIGDILKNTTTEVEADSSKDKDKDEDKGVDKADKEMSPEAVEELKKTLAGFRALLSGKKPEAEKTEKKAAENTADNAELVKSLDAIVKLLEDQLGEKSTVTKQLETFADRLKKIEKTSKGKQSIDGQEEEDGEVSKSKKKWPSLA